MAVSAAPALPNRHTSCPSFTSTGGLPSPGSVPVRTFGYGLGHFPVTKARKSGREAQGASWVRTVHHRKPDMATKLFDRTLLVSAEQALDFIGNVLESSTEYSVIGKDLDGKILLWNEGASRMYGYEPEEVI